MILDDENILIDDVKEFINNPFYALFNSFDSSELVYEVIEDKECGMTLDEWIESHKGTGGIEVDERLEYYDK